MNEGPKPSEPQPMDRLKVLAFQGWTVDALLDALVDGGVLRETSALAWLRKDGTVKAVYGDYGDVDLLTAKTNLVPVWAVVRPSDSGATGAPS